MSAFIVVVHSFADPFCLCLASLCHVLVGHLFSSATTSLKPPISQLLFVPCRLGHRGAELVACYNMVTDLLGERRIIRESALAAQAWMSKMTK